MPFFSSLRRPTAGIFAAALTVAACKRAPAPAPGAAATPAAPDAAVAPISYGNPGEPIHLTIGFQPYYTEAWSAGVVNGRELWKKHLPPGSTVDFAVGIQGALVINAMLAGKEQIGYVGDMPGIVGATKREVADLRIIANIGLSHDQCNILLTRPDAPAFKNAKEAVKWFGGKTVAVPKGSCSDRFARAVLKKEGVEPASYLNQNLELITSGFRAKKLDATVVWEPVASRLVTEGLARRVASGNDFGENDGALITVRADLLQQRPDVVKGWLEAELEAEQYLAEPAHAKEVVGFLKKYTTGYDDQALWQSLFGSYPANVGGAPVRLTLPFGFTAESLELIKRSTAFLHEVKSIAIPELPADAVLPELTAQILKEHGLTAPVATIKASTELAAK